MHKEAIVETSMRLDQFVAGHFLLSRAQAQKLIESGCIHCNGKVLRKASKRLAPGDKIQWKEQAPVVRCPTPNPHPNPIPILYEDSSCLVIEKPAGMTVHPSSTLDATELTVIELLRQQSDAPQLCLAHRLDKGTSGCLLIAKNAEACEALQAQFEKRTVHKTYLAVVSGIPVERNATIDAPLGRSLVERTKMTLFRTSSSRHAITHYKVLSSGADCSLLECSIATGRTHQIRVHLAAIGHPILGDEKYGSEQSRTLSKKFAIASPLLHAWKLVFESLVAKEHVNVEAPIPETFTTIATKVGLMPPE